MNNKNRYPVQPAAPRQVEKVEGKGHKGKRK